MLNTEELKFLIKKNVKKEEVANDLIMSLVYAIEMSYKKGYNKGVEETRNQYEFFDEYHKMLKKEGLTKN